MSIFISSPEGIKVTPEWLEFTPSDYAISQTVLVSSLTNQEVQTSITLSGGQADVQIPCHFTKVDENASFFTPSDVEYIPAKDFLVLYYDVDFPITDLFVAFDGSENWQDVDSFEHCSYTNTCTFLDLSEIQGYQLGDEIALKAERGQKSTVAEGMPTFSIDGYRIKATFGDYSEYYYASATPSTRTTNGTENTCLSFAKGDETLYLTLRSTSQSRFRIEGKAPTSFAKIIETSQHKKEPYYDKLLIYYTKENPIDSIAFVLTPPAGDWLFDYNPILKNAIETFNTQLQDVGAHIEMKEEGDSKNTVTYAIFPDSWAGLCAFRKSANLFNIYINADPYMLTSVKRVKSTTMHEFGHLLGFRDNAYAINESLMCYSRESEEVTFFQPSDIAKLKHWYGMNLSSSRKEGEEDISILFDYPTYEDPYASASLIVEGLIEPCGTTTLSFGSLPLSYNLYAIKDAKAIKGVLPDPLIIKVDSDETLDITPDKRYRLFLRTYKDVPASILSPWQGIIEL